MPLLAIVLATPGCGYKWVAWSAEGYETLSIEKVSAAPQTRQLSIRMRDALVARCLAGSGLQPVEGNGDLTLTTALRAYRESVAATGVDGRTERLQFAIAADFVLKDRQGKELWSLKNYQYSDQYDISTSQEEYRNETVFVQDNALRTIADLVITNISLAIAEAERAQ